MKSYIGRRFVPQSTIDRRVQAKDDRYARALRTRQPVAFLAPEVFPYASVEVIPAGSLTARLTDSAPPAKVICAWCPEFNPATSQGVSHGICPTCASQLEDAERLADEDQAQDGSRCGAGCGFCGRCS
jgi:hypothetical protein